MAGSLNKVQLIGNLGADPEIRTTQDGKEIANLRIATTDTWRDKMTGDKRERTEWHRVVIFSDGLIKVIKSYLKKGARIYIEGSLQTRKWTDQAGNDKYSTEIILQGWSGTLLMLDSRNSGASSGGGWQQNNSSSAPAASAGGGTSAAVAANADAFVDNDIDDEIPF